jgi:hypothetical protein
VGPGQPLGAPALACGPAIARLGKAMLAETAKTFLESAGKDLERLSGRASGGPYPVTPLSVLLVGFSHRVPSFGRCGFQSQRKPDRFRLNEQHGHGRQDSDCGGPEDCHRENDQKLAAEDAGKLASPPRLDRVMG